MTIDIDKLTEKEVSKNFNRLLLLGVLSFLYILISSIFDIYKPEIAIFTSAVFGLYWLNSMMKIFCGKRWIKKTIEEIHSGGL